MRNKLSDAKCKQAKPRWDKAKGKHVTQRLNDGGGLYLMVKPDGRKSWVFRYRNRLTGQQRDMGLGPYGPHDVTLEQARIDAGNYRALLRHLKDPIDEKNQAVEAARLAHARRMTFEDCFKGYFQDNKDSWKNAKHAAQWESTVRTYAELLLPLSVADIDTDLVLKCLRPIWKEKTETATRVRQRIETVLAWATVHKFRAGDNPARWRGHLDQILPKPTALKKVKHLAALPYADVGAFMEKLRAKDSQAARALELQILTATRPGEAMGARWAEVDLKAKTWTIPAERMKADKEHVIPLSDRAVEILKAQPEVSDFVFPGISLKRPMTTAAGMKLIKELHPGITAHGMRSTFRDWAADCTSYPREVIENALAHQLKDKAEAAYLRSNMMPKRVKLMKAWADYCATVPEEADNVTPIRKEVKA